MTSDDDDGEEWAELLEMVNNLPLKAISAEQYVAFDDSVETSTNFKGATVEGLIGSYVSEAITKEDEKTPVSESNDDTAESLEPAVPTKATAMSHFADLRRYAHENNADKICVKLLSLEMELNSTVMKQKIRKLRKITLF